MKYAEYMSLSVPYHKEDLLAVLWIGSHLLTPTTEQT
jgi:hypothetical protein